MANLGEILARIFSDIYFEKKRLRSDSEKSPGKKSKKLVSSNMEQNPIKRSLGKSFRVFGAGSSFMMKVSLKTDL